MKMWHRVAVAVGAAVGAGAIVWWLWSRRRDAPVRADLKRSKRGELVAAGEVPDTAPADEVFGGMPDGSIAAGSPAATDPGWGAPDTPMPVGGAGWSGTSTTEFDAPAEDLRFVAAPLSAPAKTDLLGSGGPSYPQSYPQRWKP